MSFLKCLSLIVSFSPGTPRGVYARKDGEVLTNFFYSILGCRFQKFEVYRPNLYGTLFWALKSAHWDQNHQNLNVLKLENHILYSDYLSRDKLSRVSRILPFFAKVCIAKKLKLLIRESLSREILG